MAPNKADLGAASEEGSLTLEVRKDFEEDFAFHLRRERQFQYVCYAAVGCLAGTLGCAGLAAVPLLMLTPAKVAIVSALGAASGSGLAYIKGKSDAEEEQGNPEPPAAPRLRRLKRIAKWGSRTLQMSRSLTSEERFAIFTEAVCTFAPWAQQAELLQRHSPKEGSTEDKALLVWRHLLPLYLFLQQGPVVEVALEFSRAVAEDRDRMFEEVRNSPTIFPRGDRRKVALATILATISALEPIGSEERERLRRLNSSRPWKRLVCQACSTAKQRSPSHRLPSARMQQQRLQHVAGAARVALRPNEVCEALSMVQPIQLPREKSTASHPDEEEDDFHSISEVSLPRDGAGVSFHQRRLDFPRGTEDHHWEVFDPTSFKLRSETYLKNSKKVPSGPAMLDLVNIDIVKIAPGGPVAPISQHRDFFPQIARQAGEERFLFLMNWIAPPYQITFVGALDVNAAWCQEPSTPQARVWQRFLQGDDDYKRDRLKVIFSVEAGPWVVKKLAVKKPTIIGRKISMRTNYRPGDFLEIIMDVTNGGKGGGYEEYCTSLVLGQAKSIEMSLCVLIEAKQEDELPEQALLTMKCNHLVFDRFQCPLVDS